MRPVMCYSQQVLSLSMWNSLKYFVIIVLFFINVYVVMSPLPSITYPNPPCVMMTDPLHMPHAYLYFSWTLPNYLSLVGIHL